jgi:hypothetical protein
VISGAVLAKFFKECPQEVVINYLETVVNKIKKVLNIKVKKVSAWPLG